MTHLIRSSGLFLCLSILILQSCTLSIPNKVETEYLLEKHKKNKKRSKGKSHKKKKSIKLF